MSAPNADGKWWSSRGAELPKPLPVHLAVGARELHTIDGEAVWCVGSAPYGLPVIVTPMQLDMLTNFRARLSTRRGHVRGPTHFLTARFLTNTDHDANKVIRYRNGNFLDLRPSNIIVEQRRPKPNAKTKDKRNNDYQS